MIWGFAFVAQRSGMDHIGPLVFNALRCLLGAATVYVVIALRERRTVATLRARGGRHLAATTARGGLATGVVLFVASTLQQVGLVYTDAGKAGFLTALYVVLVPVIGVLLGRRTQWNTWVAAAVAVVGLYLLSVTGTLHIEPGNLIVLAGAVFWALHIIVTDHFVARVDVFRMCALQFLVSGALSALAAPWLDSFFVPDGGPFWPALRAALPAVLFTGVLSSGVGFTSQALAQRFVPPTVAAIVMGLESVFAAIGGTLVLGEVLTSRELVGCALMLAAVVLAQLPLGSGRGRGPDAAPGTPAGADRPADTPV
jgi:drug/metabolite transporter (DMT)-like permease